MSLLFPFFFIMYIFLCFNLLAYLLYTLDWELRNVEFYFRRKINVDSWEMVVKLEIGIFTLKLIYLEYYFQHHIQIFFKVFSICFIKKFHIGSAGVETVCWLYENPLTDRYDTESCDQITD